MLVVSWLLHGAVPVALRVPARLSSMQEVGDPFALLLSSSTCLFETVGTVRAACWLGCRLVSTVQQPTCSPVPATTPPHPTSPPHTPHTPRLAKQEVELSSLQLEVRQAHQDLTRKVGGERVGTACGCCVSMLRQACAWAVCLQHRCQLLAPSSVDRQQPMATPCYVATAKACAASHTAV